jgi:hypothetical protein
LLQQEQCTKQCFPTQGQESKKRGGKTSRGLGSMVLHPLPPPLPSPLRPMCSITPPPPLQCRGVCGGFFGPALTFAAMSMEHTANQLWQWAREQDPEVKSFDKSLLLASRSICIPYRGIPGMDFFLSKSCSRNCSSIKHCVLQQSTSRTKFEGALSLLSSALGSGHNNKHSEESSIGSKRDLYDSR